MRAVVVAMALLTAMASGCFVEDKDPETQDTDATTTSGSAAPGGPRTTSATSTRTGPTGGTGNATDLAPTANLTSSAANGTAPLNVTFTIQGSDPEGANLTWTLELHNGTLGNGTGNATGNATGTPIGSGTLAPSNGTYAPANLTHQFPSAGNYTVVLTVRDAANNATAQAVVVVTGGGSVGPIETQYVTIKPDGTCDAKGERTVGPIHIHDRPSSPPEPGFLAGDGTWVYQESNGIPGLQIGGPDESAQWRACKNPDTLRF